MVKTTPAHHDMWATSEGDIAAQQADRFENHRGCGGDPSYANILRVERIKEIR